MAEAPAPFDLPNFPSDLVLAVARSAERDAELIGLFLDTYSATPAGRWLVDRPMRLPAAFLLGLGASIRIALWERSGIHIHRAAGLPSAREALHDVLRSPLDPDAAARTASLPARVFGLFINHFAWSGCLELNADVTLGEADEETLLEALADFLWAHRPC